MTDSFLLQQILDALRAGGIEVYQFLLGKALGAFFPAFFIAGAMATLVSKQALVRYLSPRYGKVRSYFFATVSGSFLTVCSCSVLPLFTAFVEGGVATGPAFTFLAATPAINPISIFFAYTLIGPEFAFGMIVVTMFMSVVVGLILHRFHPWEEEDIQEPKVLSLFRKKRRPIHTVALFFVLTVMVFILPLEGIHWGFKLAWVLGGIVGVRFLVKRYFEPEDVEAWIDKSLDLMRKILPMIFLGIFVTGILRHTIDPEGAIAQRMEDPSFLTCLICATFASAGYMGSIVCVTFVKCLLDLGLAKGAAMAILITGPGVSMATVFTISRYVGARRAWAFLVLVTVVSAFAGWVFGRLV